jgi:uncharacterized membrane protein YdfJ with MMPL/SSD domain
MFRSSRDKETKRFYLLPGMGGRAWRRKQNLILKWSVAAAVIACVILGILFFLLDG